MKTYLVEAYSDETEFDKDSLIVALTPEVCYQLDKKGIKYSIIEDYYNVLELSSQVEEHRKSVFHWIDEFDVFLLKNIKGLEFKLATIYRWYLKGAILDPIYIRCYSLRHLFRAVKPTDVTYISPKPKETTINDSLYELGQSLYSQVIPIICREKNIPLTVTSLEVEAEKNKASILLNRQESAAARLKKTLAKNPFIKRIYFILRYLKCLPKLNKAGDEKKRFLLPIVQYTGEDFVAEASSRGHKVFLLSGNKIMKYSWYGMRKYADINMKAHPEIESYLASAADLLKGHELVKWINEKCRLGVSEIVLPRLRYFLLKICPELIGYIEAFAEFYEAAAINIFFTPVIASLSEYAALAAANRSPQVMTACLMHGDAVYDSCVWNITELENYDIHISSNIEMTEYFRKLATGIGSSAKIFSHPHRLRYVRKTGRQREKIGNKSIIKNRVVYVPLFMRWDAIRLEGYPYTDTYFFNFQKKLLEHFSTRKDFTFVWKGLPQSDFIYNPIPDFIKDNNFSNVEIATTPFVQHLLTADRVILDMPSTAFYEAILAGIPTMSLCHKAQILRKGAAEYYDNLLKFFTDIPEAIKYIDNFLNGDPDDYKMKIDMAEGSLFDIFEGNGK